MPKASNSVAITGGGSTEVAALFGGVPARRGKEKVMATPSPISPLASQKARIVFSLDATASRVPTWSRAQRVQGAMFEAMSGKGQVQLASFGGYHLTVSGWADDSRELADAMSGVTCKAGLTQIASLLRHYQSEAKAGRLVAVYVGDTAEEDTAELEREARACGLLGVPVFVFHELGNEGAADTLRKIAELSGGAYVRFADGDPQGDLQPLLGAVASYAEGGRKALLRYGSQHRSEAVQRLTQQLKIEGPR